MSRLVENRALREAFKRGDRRALEEVYRAYVRGLYGFVQRKLPSSDPFEVDNVVQEVFVRAFGERARMTYDGLRPYKNYLFTIAGNFIIDQQRRKRHVHVSVDGSGAGTTDNEQAAPLQLPDDNSMAPEQQALDQEVQRLTRKFIDDLDPDLRLIFEARFSEGLSVEACSAKLGVSEYRVKRDEKRLRKLFFGYMKREGYFEGYTQAQMSAVMGVLLLSVASALLQQIGGRAW